VFLNVPFSASHEPIFVALIAGLTALGLSPRCVLEVPPQQNRLDRGLAVAIALEKPGRSSHQFRILEAEPYRLQKSLSDLLGFDPYIHHGRAEGTLEALLNVFDNLPGAPELFELRRVHRLLRQYRNTVLGRDIFQSKAFSKLVVATRLLAG
jgi:hypothetical protein